MLEILQSLNGEMIAGGIVGLVMIGVAARNAIIGWHEAMRKVKAAETNTAPMVAALSVSWDRDQIERALQLLEKIADAIAANARYSEQISNAQKILADQFQQTTHEKLEDILERLDHAEKAQASRGSRRRT
jgi:biopolymer transport protein ExbB/TolQ